MKSALFYKAMSRFYDLLDVIYFRKYDTSPRRVVNEAIKDHDKILDLPLPPRPPPPAGADEVRDLLESVAQKNYPQTADRYEKTMWSIVYCPEERCADFYFAEEFTHSYGLILSEKGAFLTR